MNINCLHCGTPKKLSSVAGLIAFGMTFTLIIHMQTAFAAFEPTGKFLKRETGRVEAIYIVGNEKIVLSQDAQGVYKNAVAGDAGAQYEFAKVLNSSAGKAHATPRVASEAVAWAMQSAKQGNADGENYVGLSYKNGDGVPKDVRESERWLKKAIEHGSAKAMYNLAILYSDQGDFEKAVQFARKSAVFGYAPGQLLWGRMNYNGQGTPVDMKKAVAWFMKAHKQGDIDAIGLLALCYQNGEGVRKDELKAAELYEEIVEKSDDMLKATLAKAALAVLYFSRELPNGKSLALKWAQEALHGGGEQTLQKERLGKLVAGLQFVIGYTYYEGKCVKQDFGLANEWLEKARAGGNNQAGAVLAIIANEQRKLEELKLAAQKAAEEAEQRRLEEERRRIAEAEREERRQRSEGARRKRASMSAEDRAEQDARAMTLRRQYDNLLAIYGLSEAHFSVDNGCSELVLLGSEFDETYRIDYYLNGDRMTYTGTMPESVARRLVTLRVRIWIAEY